MEEKVRGEKGIKYIKIEKKTEENENCETGGRDKDEMYKMIIKILEEYEAPKKDKDEEYIKSKEGCYEKYIRTYFPEVLEKKEYGKIWHKKENVIFYYEGKILAIKYINVYRNGDEKRFNIGKYNFRLKQPETVEKKITFKNKEMEAKELYKAVIKLGAIMCDVKEMA